MNKRSANTTRLVVTAFLIALEIIFTRFLSINLPTLRIGFGFLPVAMLGIMYGPVWAGIGYATGDFLGMLLFPNGTYFPGFTLTAFLTGIVYGFVLHNKPFSIRRIMVACGLVLFVLNLCLDTLWLHILMGDAVIAMMPARILKCAVMFPIQCALIPLVWKTIINKLPAGIYHSDLQSSQAADPR